MSISDRFSGLDIGKLIGDPLKAADEAQKQLSESTAEFIRQVGFDAKGKARTVKHETTRKKGNEDKTGQPDKMKAEVPAGAKEEDLV